MRAALLVLLVAGTTLAGCTRPAPEPPPPVLPVLRMHLTLEGSTTFEAGEVLGSPQGARVFPFHFDDEAKRVVADLPPEGARQLVAVDGAGDAPELLADVTRATFSAPSPDRPAVLQFVHDGATGEWRLDVVQPTTCRATVEAAGRVTNGTGPFRPPTLAPGDGVVFALEGGGEECAGARVEALALGAWTVVPPRD